MVTGNEWPHVDVEPDAGLLEGAAVVVLGHPRRARVAVDRQFVVLWVLGLGAGQRVRVVVVGVVLARLDRG